MLIQISNPSTNLNNVYQEVWRECEKIGDFTFTTENMGHAVCHGKLGDKVARVFVPISDSLGNAYMQAEILCMVELLRKHGLEVNFGGEVIELRPVRSVKVKITESYLTGASSLNDCKRRLEDAGYTDMHLLEDHLDSLRRNGRRVNKYDIAKFVCKPQVNVIQSTDQRKTQRAGNEWLKVRELVKDNVPLGYQNADEFATFATKEEVDGIKQSSN